MEKVVIKYKSTILVKFKCLDINYQSVAGCERFSLIDSHGRHGMVQPAFNTMQVLIIYSMQIEISKIVELFFWCFDLRK